MNRKLWKWLAWSTIDGVGRLLMLVIGTSVLSRLLAPRDLGLSALILTVVTFASVFVGAPFEEALAQRKVLRRAHIASVLAVSWAIAALFMIAAIPVAYLMAWGYQQPDVVWFLPVASLSIILSGQGDIMTGVARRLRRFDVISIATLAGHTVGVLLAIALAVFGYGVWALIWQRIATFAVRAVVLQGYLRLWVTPRWHAGHHKDVSRFAGISLLDRLSDNLNHLAFNTVVASLYGLSALGYVNMAMRLIEPIRALVGIAAHNLAFSHFAAAQGDDEDLVQRVQATSAQTSLFIVPIFAGLAAVTPVLLPIFAGRGWEPAIPIGVFLAIGSAVALPARQIFSALSAKGRPEFSLLANATGVVSTMFVLFAASPFGPVSVGAARLAGDSTQALVAILVSPRGFAWSRQARLLMLSKAWLLSATMGCLVSLLIFALPGQYAIPRLLFSMLAGGGVYAALLLMFVPAQFHSIVGHFRRLLG